MIKIFSVNQSRRAKNLVTIWVFATIWEVLVVDFLFNVKKYVLPYTIFPDIKNDYEWLNVWKTSSLFTRNS